MENKSSDAFYYKEMEDIVMDNKIETLQHLMKFCVDKINDMKSNENKGEYGTGCIDAWTEVVNEIDELLHPEMYQ